MALRRFSRKTCRTPFRPNFVHLETRETPATLTVNTATDGINHGDSLLTLREAVAALNAASTAGFSAGEIAQINTSPFNFGKLDSIRFDASLAGSTITLTLNAVSVAKAVSISGLTNTGGITISGGGTKQHFLVNDGTATNLAVSINNLTLTNGSGATGGSIFNNENLTVNNCAFSNNTTTGIGGAINSDGSLTINNSSFMGNKSQFQGGAVGFVKSASTYSVTNCTFAFNIADTDNTGDKGGAILLNGTAVLNNNIFVGNIGKSTAPDELFGTLGSTFTGSNNLIGSANSAGGFVNGTNGNLVGINGSGTRPANTVISTTLASNGGPTKTFALAAGSVAINAGKNAAVGAIVADQRGNPFARINEGTVDIGAFESGPQTFVVSIAADENDGNFAANDLSFREAVASANANPGEDTITFAGALSGQTITGTSLWNLNVSESKLTIIGPGASQLTIASGPTGSHLFSVFGDLSVSGITLTGFDSGSSGGSVFSVGDIGNLTLNDVTLSENTSAGGAIFIGGGKATLTNCILISNAAENGQFTADGGAMVIGSNSIVSINNCSISNNIANRNGGGIHTNGTLSITNSRIESNGGNGNGGGIYIEGGVVTISNSLVFNNLTTGATGAGFGIGGGIQNNGLLNVSNATFSGNIAQNDGSALANFGTATITSSTITLNKLGINPTASGAILTAAAKSTSLFGTIVAGNTTNGTEQNLGNTAVQSVSKFNLIGPGPGTGGLTNGVNGNLVGVDAKLGSLAQNGGTTKTHALFFGSPALNAGDPAVTGTIDQRGFVQNGTRDIGAFEVQAVTLAPATLASGSVNVAYSQQLSSNTPTLPPGQTYTFTVESGTLPTGLSLASSGKITGTPTVVGTSNFTVTSTAGTGDFGSQAFTITISDASNTPPTISDIANQASTGTAIANIHFTIGDAQTPAANLKLSAATSNATLIPLGNITFGGSGANRTVTVAPANGQFGTATITVTVTDTGGAIATDSFLVVVNTPPTISDIANQSSTGGSIANVPFTIADAQTPSNNLDVSAKSSNAVLVPVGNITFGGSNANRTITLVPASGQTGTSTITVTVTDAGGLNASDTFVVTVSTPVNSAPTITDVANQSSTGSAVGPLAFIIDDVETPVGNLVVTRASSNLTLVPLANVVLGGSGENRTVTVTPVAGQFGSTTITLTVTDAGGKSATDTFAFTVTNPANANSPLLVGFKQFGVGTDVGDGSVKLFNPDGTLRFALTPFPGFTGGLRTAAGDFTGDGIADLVVGTGPGGPTHVKVFNGATQAELFSVDPFEASFTGGVYVAAGDINGDRVADLVITPDEGGGPRVRAFTGKGFNQIADFFGIDDKNFRGGARASIGDLNGDGSGDLVVVAGFGGGPRVAAFDGKQLQSNGGPKLFNDFFAFEQALRNGIFVAAGDVNGDGFADLVAGGGPGGGPRVFILDGKTLVQNGSNTLVPVGNFFAGDQANRGGIRVAVKNLDNDGRADVVTGAGTGAGSHVTAYRGTTITPAGTPPAFLDFDAFASFGGGVFVG